MVSLCLTCTGCGWYAQCRLPSAWQSRESLRLQRLVTLARMLLLTSMPCLQVSHYFDSDPTKLVAGLREDGRAPASFIADTTTANAQVGHAVLPAATVCTAMFACGFECASVPDGPETNMREYNTCKGVSDGQRLCLGANQLRCASGRRS